jgi:hypothetical protein
MKHLQHEVNKALERPGGPGYSLALAEQPLDETQFRRRSDSAFYFWAPLY